MTRVQEVSRRVKQDHEQLARMTITVASFGTWSLGPGFLSCSVSSARQILPCIYKCIAKYSELSGDIKGDLSANTEQFQTQWREREVSIWITKPCNIEHQEHYQQWIEVVREDGFGIKIRLQRDSRKIYRICKRNGRDFLLQERGSRYKGPGAEMRAQSLQDSGIWRVWELCVCEGGMSRGIRWWIQWNHFVEGFWSLQRSRVVMYGRKIILSQVPLQSRSTSASQAPALMLILQTRSARWLAASQIYETVTEWRQ